MSENEKIRSFKEKTFSQIFLWDFVAEWSIDNPGEKLLRRNRYMLAHSPKKKKNVSHQKTFFPQCSIGQVKCSFDNAIRNKLQEIRKNLRQCAKKIKTFFQAALFFPYAPMVNRMKFRQPRRKFLQAGRKKLTQSPKLFEENFWRKNYPQNVILDSAIERSFDEPGESFCRKAESLSLNLRKWRNEIFLSTQKFLPKILVWTRRLHFWQTCQKKTWEEAKKISLNVQEQWKENFKKNVSPKTFSWSPTEKLVLTTLTKTNRQQAENLSFNVQKRKKVGFAKKKLSLKSFSRTPRAKAVFTTLTETIRQHAGNVSLNARKRIRKRFFKEKTFPQIFLSDFVGEWIVGNPGGNFLLCSRYFVIHCLKLEERTFFIRKHFSKSSSEQVKFSFDNAAGNILPEVRKISRRCAKKMNIFFKRLYFSSFLLWQTVCSFYKPTEGPCKQTEKI